MIARIWHGVVPQQKAERYYDYLKTTGLPDYRKSEGNISVQVLRRQENEQTHYLLITFWDSYESIKHFAGEEYEKARYYPRDEEFLLELESSVDHYEILEKSRYD